MADRAITALNEATSMTDADLFAISQGGQAKKVTWVTFYSYLAEALDGHGGIKDIDYTSPSSGSLEGTLTITLGDDTEESFVITNGRGITSISKTGTSGLTDTYTITYNNGTTSTFTINNGRGITGFTKSTSGLTDTYTITYNDGTTSEIVVTNGKAITGIADKWAVSDSNSTVPSTWYDDPQTMTPENKYEWHYQIVTFNDGTTLDTDKAVTGVYGDTGQDWHVFIKWSAEEPDSDSDMKDTADNWIGIYSGTASTAPTTYTSYTWFEYKGDKGDTGTSITSVSLYSSSGLVDTYRVTFSDGTYTSFNVTNGASIQSIAKTSTSGLVDTYTVTLTDNTTTTFQVTNGKGISSITEVDVTHAAGHTDVYRINFNDGDTYSFSIYNGTNGSGSVSTVDDIQSSNQNVPLLSLGSGPPTTSTQGFLKSRYFDQTNSILYICVGIDTSGAETTYTWQGAGVTVDSALSTMSTNPVQNAVLTAIIGTATLTTTAQTLTQAVNELDAGKVDNGVITEYVETTTTASRAYSIGDHILLNGVRYEVTAVISSGGTITVGTNVTARNVDADLASLKTALNTKVSKSGDTMTGELKVKNSNITDGTIPEDAQHNPTEMFDSDFQLLDSNGYRVGAVVADFLADGNQGMVLQTRRSIGGTNITNFLGLFIKPDGTRNVIVPDSSIWRRALGIITVTKTGTTDSNGNFVSDLSKNDYEVIAANTGGAICIPYVQTLNAGGKICCHVMSISSQTPMAEVSASIDFTLITK